MTYFIFKLFIKPDIQFVHEEIIGEINLRIVNNENVNLIDVRLKTNYLTDIQSGNLLDLFPDKNFSKGLVEIGYKIPHNSDNTVVSIAQTPNINILIFYMDRNTRFFQASNNRLNCSSHQYSIGFQFTYKLEDEEEFAKPKTIPPKKIIHTYHDRNRHDFGDAEIMDNLSWE